MISSLPHCFTAAWMRCSMDSGLVTSALTKIESPPLAFMRSWVGPSDSVAVGSKGQKFSFISILVWRYSPAGFTLQVFSWRSAQTIFAPSAAIANAVARPMPDDEPVMIAIRSLRRSGILGVNESRQKNWVKS